MPPPLPYAIEFRVDRSGLSKVSQSRLTRHGSLHSSQFQQPLASFAGPYSHSFPQPDGGRPPHLRGVSLFSLESSDTTAILTTYVITSNTHAHIYNSIQFYSLDFANQARGFRFLSFYIISISLISLDAFRLNSCVVTGLHGLRKVGGFSC